MKKGIKSINKKALILPYEGILLISNRRKNLKKIFLPLFIDSLDPGGEMDIGIDPGKAVSTYVLEPVKNFFNKYIIPNYSDLLGSNAPYSIW